MTAQAIPGSIRIHPSGKKAVMPEAIDTPKEKMLDDVDNTTFFQRLFSLKNMALSTALAIPLAFVGLYTINHVQRHLEIKEYMASRAIIHSEEQKKKSPRATPVRVKAANALAFINDHFPEYSEHAEKIVDDLDHRVNNNIDTHVDAFRNQIREIRLKHQPIWGNISFGRK